jgi:hypothetical protein
MSSMRTAAVLVAILAARSLPAAAQGAPSPEVLCRTLASAEEDGVGPVRCRVVRTARRGPVRAAVLRVSSGRMDELRLAVRTSGGWRAIGFAGRAYDFQDLRGAIEALSFAVADVIPGGSPEIDLTVRRWQSELDSADSCSVQAAPEIHRYVCADREGWRCMHITTEVEPEETRVIERPCPSVARAPAPGWSIELAFTGSTLQVRRRDGALPEVIARWVGEHSLDAIFSADPATAFPDSI